MQRYLHEHFLSESHNGLINDVESIFIDKTDPSDPTRREEFWKTKLKTLAPYGLNLEEWLLMSLDALSLHISIILPYIMSQNVSF